MSFTSELGSRKTADTSFNSFRSIGQNLLCSRSVGGCLGAGLGWGAGPCFHSHTKLGGGWPMLSLTQNWVPRPSRVLCERAGLLADIAAADHRIHAERLTATRCPARFSLAAPSCRGRIVSVWVQGRSAQIPSAGSGQALRRQAFASRRPALPQDDIEKGGF
jgi:hypothetical protein